MEMKEKTVCPIDAGEFMKNAKPLEIRIGDQVKVAMPKMFSTGSFGWYLNDKTTVEVNGKMVQVQLGGNLIIANSKEAPRGDAAPPAPAATPAKGSNKKAG